MITTRLKFDFHYGRFLLDRELQFSFRSAQTYKVDAFVFFFFLLLGGRGTWVPTLLETYIKLNLAS